MFPAYATLLTILGLIFLYVVRVDFAYRTTVKRQSRIYLEMTKRGGSQNKEALAWANEQYAKIPSYNCLMVDLRNWTYNDVFKDF